MFMEMSQRQSEVVNVLLDSLDSLDRSDWSHAFLHAEFRDEEGVLLQSSEGFLVVDEDGRRERAALPVAAEVSVALVKMHATYAEAGHGFSRLDLVVDGDGRYRFDLGDTPSLTLAGKPDPEARERFDRRFAELAGKRTA